MLTDTPSNSLRSRKRTRRKPDSGFTLLEMVVAMVILTSGLLALASAISYALMATNSGRGITNAKLLVASIHEQMETLRNTGQLTFGQMANAGQVDNTGGGNFAGFPTEFLTVSRNPGPDGIFGTADDLIDAGPDKKYGTQDDWTNPALAACACTRQILITSLGSQLKRVQVTLRYSASFEQELVSVSYLNDDSHGNYLQ
jgi:prepilin-type N-terminal cleavage/methylation domain-containing protein